MSRYTASTSTCDNVLSLSPSPPFFPFSRAESRSTVSPRHGLRTFRETSPNFFHLPLEGKEDFSKMCAILEKDRQQKQNIQRNNDSSRIYNI